MDRVPIVLASTSPYRRALLERLGVPFECESPGVDEELAHAGGTASPPELAMSLARQKSEAVAARRPEAVVIGADQVCALGTEILPKPGSAEGAVAQLARLSGNTHRLFTAVVIRCGRRIFEHLDETVLTMRRLSEAEVRRYVERDAPLQCAGAYKLECGGVALFERIESADHTAIVGLPLMAVTSALRDLGIAIP